MTDTEKDIEIKDYTDTVARLNREHFTSSLSNLKDFIGEKCDDERVYVDTRFSAVNEAVKLANEAMQVRLEHLNNSQQVIQRMGDKYPNKSDLENLATRYELQVKAYDEDIRYLRESKAEIAGKASAESVNVVRETVARNQMLVMVGLTISFISLACGGIGTLVAIVGMIMKFIWT
jgi:hypothetical protein